MIKIQNLTLDSKNFVDAFSKLCKVTEVSLETLMKVMKIRRQLVDYSKDMNEVKIKIITKYAEKTPEGNPKRLMNGDFDVSDNNIPLLESELKPFLELALEINDVDKIPIKEFNRVKFNAEELCALDDIIDFT